MKLYKPAEVLKIVKEVCNEYMLRDIHINHLQRFYLRQYFPWLTLKQIGTLTHCNHSTVLLSIRKVDTLKNYTHIKTEINNTLLLQPKSFKKYRATKKQ